MRRARVYVQLDLNAADSQPAGVVEVLVKKQVEAAGADPRMRQAVQRICQRW